MGNHEHWKNDGSFTYSNVVRLAQTEEVAKKISIYPIPAKGSVWVETDLQAGRQIGYRIVNVTGAAVQSGFISSSKQKISIAELKAGVYYLSVEGYAAQKVVVN